MRRLADLVEYLDHYLRVPEIPDAEHAWNGLQVENSGSIGGIVAAVDASQATIDGVVAAARGPGVAPSLLLVDHGLFWDGEQPVTGRRYRRLRALLEHDLALYSAHIPLDVHPEVGNNGVLAAALDLEDTKPFDDYHGTPLGVAGRLAIEREALVARSTPCSAHPRGASRAGRRSPGRSASSRGRRGAESVRRGRRGATPWEFHDHPTGL